MPLLFEKWRGIPPPPAPLLRRHCCRGAGHDVLGLPIAHCELNPIELVWAQVKVYAARHNKKFTMVEAVNLGNEGIAAVTTENRAAFVKDVVNKVEPHLGAGSLDRRDNRRVRDSQWARIR